MKKVINITIGNRIFWIEEDAYAVLQDYLLGIEKHFQAEDSSGEILEDIESSIGEKLAGKRKNEKDAISQTDIQKIISELGSLEELTDSEDSSGVTQNKQETEQDTEQKTQKTLYRNTDNKVIAGVASGVADYFGIDPIIIRVLFVISLFLNGIGALIYIALWIMVPAAKTASQKLAMKGEATNLESIERYFENQSKKKIVNSGLQKLMTVPVKIVNFIIQVFQRLFPVVRVICGVFISFLASIVLFFLTTFLMAVATGGAEMRMSQNLRIIFDELIQIETFPFIVSSAFLVIFIPFFLLLLCGFYLILKRKMIGLGVFLFLFITWMFSLSYFAMSVVTNTQTIEEIAQSVGEEIAQDEEYYLHIGNREDEYFDDIEEEVEGFTQELFEDL